VCTGGATCPADYPGCNPGAVTTPPFSAASCGSGELDALAAACTGGGTSTACAQFFQRLLSANPRCYDCMLQFTGSDAYTRCVAPFLTQSCNHDLTCALDCSNVACDRCPTAQEGTCRQLAFDAGAQCNAWINGYYCLQAALGGPAEFCDVERYAGAGDWLRAVGEQYCRR
jgi:hypothetical protein